MKSLILLIVFFCMISVANAQTSAFDNFEGSNFSRMKATAPSLKEGISSPKWFVNRYSGISTTFTAWKGGFASIIAAPVGIQLNRRLNNNLYAFASVTAAPSYINFRQNFVKQDFGKSSYNNSFIGRTNNFSLYSRADIGVMYVNDQRTFSISGSIGVERSNYPFPAGMQMNSLQMNNRWNNNAAY